MLLRLLPRLAAFFPLSIAARLTLSFIAVAVLAATANFIARGTVSIIYVAPAAAPASTAPVTVAPKPTTHRALMAALQAFEQALQQRIDDNAKSSDGDYARAAEALRRGAADMPSLEARAIDVIAHGQQAILVADQRRAARSAYENLTDTLDQRLRSAMDGSLKLFGRVLTRQSLLQLRNALDHLRDVSQALSQSGALKPGERARIDAAENSFSSTLNANRSGLERSEGGEWLAAMTADFAGLMTARTALERGFIDSADAARQVFQSRVALSRAILAADSAANRAYMPPAPLASLPDVVGSMQTEERQAEEAAQTAANERNHRSREMMAVVTLLVMLLVIAISLATIRSVSMPVRRILEASKRVAWGSSNVAVPRGGVRELDTLAAAFNAMATRLTAAQDAARLHQATLENKVQERTQKLSQLAQQDPLTSLPNRRHLLTLLNYSLANAARDNSPVWVYFIDLDNFKNFNDSEGHVFGDRVLMSVAKRLEEIADGLGFVARLGGDEFTLVCDQAQTADTVQSVGRRIVNAFQTLISVDQRDLSVSVSIGASVFPQHGRDAESLLRAADSALFRAKELGRSQVAIFTPELLESAAQRFTIEQGLRRALEARQFELHFQPEFRLADAEMDLVEALIRWRMPDGSLARPGEFLAIAEQSGLITQINEWVLQSAVEAAARWHHSNWRAVTVAVNISPRQLMDHRFLDTLLDLTRKHRLPAACIELELTETVLQTLPATIAALRALHAHGFRIALDDFGTGYSSLTSLEQLPLSRIKLDRSLIARIDTSPRAASIARTIIELCSALSLKVTAEGVERPQQLAWLMQYPELTVQGFLLSDSLPAAQVAQARPILSRLLDDLRWSNFRRAIDRPVPLQHKR